MLDSQILFGIFPGWAHSQSLAFRRTVFQCLGIRNILAGSRMPTFSNNFLSLCTYDCQAAETEALDILKGAEVERSAMLKASKTDAAAAVQAAPAADGATGQAAYVVKKPPAPVVENKPAPVVAKTEPSTSSPDTVSPS